MNDQSGVKSSKGKKTKEAGASAGCSQGDIGQSQRKNKRKRSNFLDATSRDPDSDSSDSDTNTGTCINHLVFMATSWKY